MNESTIQSNIGGQFLLEPISKATVYSREDFSEEHTQIYNMVLEFDRDRVLAQKEEIEKYDPDLAKALISLPATRGLEFGLGFQSALLMGSQHNDPFVMENQRVRTRSNHSAGMQGGISNGENIELRVAFKPTATILREQDTVTRDGQTAKLMATGRHDPCVGLRATPIAEAMLAIVLMDHFLRHRAQNADVKT